MNKVTTFNLRWCGPGDGRAGLRADGGRAGAAADPLPMAPICAVDLPAARR